MPEDLVWHHRTWWAVTSQTGGRGKALLLSALSLVQALPSLRAQGAVSLQVILPMCVFWGNSWDRPPLLLHQCVHLHG